MITEKDLDSAIAECQGIREPDSSVCIKLAAFYTLKNELFPKRKEFDPPTYSLTAPTVTGISERVISYNSGTEFSRVIDGRRAADVWAVMDELMSALCAIYPRLYNATLSKIEQ